MNTNESSKQPRPSYEDNEPRTPDVARLIEERGTTRGNFMAVVKKAAATERRASPSRLDKEDARTKA